MTDISNIQGPPNDFELEQKVLCALINNPKLLEGTRLTKRDFFSSMNETIYETLLEMKEEKKTIDAWTLESELKKKHKRKKFGVEDISLLLVSYSSYEDDELRLIEYRKARDIINHSKNIIAMCNDSGDVSVINAEVDEMLDVLSSADSKKIDMASVVIDAFEALSTKPDYITAGYEQLDNILGGFSAGQLVIIAGRPGAGKTAAMLNMMYQQCKAGHKIGMFSLEMSTQELLFRLFSLSTGIPFGRIQSRKLLDGDRDKIADQSQTIINKMEIVDDCFSLSQIKNKSKSMVKIHGCKAIYIDYLQLISNGKPTANRNNDVSILTRDLKMLAKELGVPILLGSQLNRGVEARVDKRPYLADLRDSGSIEQDADCVIMLHRDDYYDTDSVPNGHMDFLIRKHRNGPVGEPTLHFEAHTMAVHNHKEKPF